MTCISECGAVTPSQAHCSTCHRTFGGVSNFDRHRRDGRCVPPETLGMELKGLVWRTPMSVEARNRFGGRSGRGTEDKGR